MLVKLSAINRVIDILHNFNKYSFVSNCKRGGGQIANFEKKKPSSSFNYHKRMNTCKNFSKLFVYISTLNNGIEQLLWIFTYSRNNCAFYRPELNL